MQFRESLPIYIQIAHHVCEKILLNEWKPGERVPSVRELAVLLAVNPNTVVRSYEFLEGRDIIFNERGIGFSVSAKGIKNSHSYLQSELTEKEMPSVFRQLILLDMDLDDVKPYFDKFKRKNALALTKRS